MQNVSSSSIWHFSAVSLHLCTYHLEDITDGTAGQEGVDFKCSSIHCLHYLSFTVTFTQSYWDSSILYICSWWHQPTVIVLMINHIQLGLMWENSYPGMSEIHAFFFTHHTVPGNHLVAIYVLNPNSVTSWSIFERSASMYTDFSENNFKSHYYKNKSLHRLQTRLEFRFFGLSFFQVEQLSLERLYELSSSDWKLYNRVTFMVTVFCLYWMCLCFCLTVNWMYLFENNKCEPG